MGIAAALGCASLKSSSWDKHCYPEMNSDATKIAGPNAVDRGFLTRGSTVDQRESTIQCALRAVESGAPFKFGYTELFEDSMICEVAIRGESGQLVRLAYDAGSANGFDESRPQVWSS